jgi:hypothetical protein
MYACFNLFKKYYISLAGWVAQVVEHQLIKHEALSSNTSTTKKILYLSNNGCGYKSFSKPWDDGGGGDNSKKSLLVID